jgi:hypothetical protein
MNTKALTAHGEHVNKFARAVPNMGRIGDLTRSTLEMLRSNDWRDYTDATGIYHFLPGEFDYFLALQTVDAKDVARFYLSPDERVEVAAAMDRSRSGEDTYRRQLPEIVAAHPHAASSLTQFWDKFGWESARHPVGARALARAKTGLTKEEHAKRERVKRLKQLRDGWRVRVQQVVSAADGFTREEIFAAVDALRELARKAPTANDEREQWRADAEELGRSEAKCADRWGISRDAARKRLARI